MTSPSPAPLTTPRLVLTPIGETDFADLLALTSHPEVGGKLKHGVLGEEATRAQLDAYLSTWAKRGFGVFVMRRTEDAAFVGIVGLWDHDDDLGVALRYAVMPAHRGQGFTIEAVKAVLAFAETRKLGKVIAVTRETNLASRKILSDLGFHLREIRSHAEHRTVIYEQQAGDGP